MYRSPQKNFPIEKKIGPPNHAASMSRKRRTIMRSINNLHVIAIIIVENLENRFHQKFQQKSWPIGIKSGAQQCIVLLKKIFQSKRKSARRITSMSRKRRTIMRSINNLHVIATIVGHWWKTEGYNGWPAEGMSSRWCGHRVTSRDLDAGRRLVTVRGRIVILI